MVVSLAVPVFLYMRIQDARAQVAEIEVAHAEASLREAEEKAAKQRVQATAPLRAQLEPLSISKDDAASFIAGIERVAKETNVSLGLSTVEVTGETAGRLRTLSMQANAEGTLQGVMTFLRLCETLPTATAVSGVSLERKEKTWVLSATLTTPIKMSQ
jgi:hypothetical protein